MNIIKACLSAIKLSFNGNKNSGWYSFRRTHLMPEAEYKRLILKKLQLTYNLDTFVETGTYLGETPLALNSLFKKIYTIELSEELYKSAQDKLSVFPNITAIQGDSSIVLKQIVPKLNTAAIFFLDGHYSGEGTATSSKTHPIIEELEIISNSDVDEHIIVIDDISDFTARENNAPLSQVLEKLESINPNYKFYSDYDMLFALPNETIHREFWRKVAPYFVIR